MRAGEGSFSGALNDVDEDGRTGDTVDVAGIITARIDG